MSLSMRGLAVVCCLLAMSGTMARGATAKASDPVRLSAELGAARTDNRDSGPVKEDNTDYYVRPKVDIVSKGEAIEATGFYAPSYRFRDNPSAIQNESELFHALEMELKYRATPRMAPYLREVFNYTDDPSVTAAGEIQRRESTYILNRTEAGMNYAIARYSAVDLRGTYEIKRYSDSLVAEESDEDAVGAWCTGWKQVSRTLGLLVGARYEAFGYQEVGDIQRDFDLMVLMAGFEKALTPSLRGGVRAGWSVASYEDPGLDSVSLPFVRASVEGEAAPFRLVRATLNHSLRDSDVYPFASQKNTDFSLEAEYDLRNNFIVAAGAKYQLGTYDEDSAPSTAPDSAYKAAREGDETTVAFTLGLTYNVSKDTSVRLEQSLEDVESDVDEAWDRNTTTVRLSRLF